MKNLLFRWYKNNKINQRMLKKRNKKIKRRKKNLKPNWVKVFSKILRLLIMKMSYFLFSLLL